MAQSEWTNTVGGIISDTTTTPPSGESSPVARLTTTNASGSFRYFHPTSNSVEGKSTLGFNEGGAEVWCMRANSADAVGLVFHANSPVNWGGAQTNAYYCYISNTDISLRKGTPPGTIIATSPTITGINTLNVWRGIRAQWWKSSPNNYMYIRTSYNLNDGNGWQFAMNDIADSSPYSDDPNCEVGIAHTMNSSGNNLKLDGFRLYTKS